MSAAKEKSAGKEGARARKGVSILTLQIMAFLMAVLLAVILFKLTSGGGAAGGGARVETFESKYCSLLRPGGWSGKLDGDTFVFRNPERDFIAAIDQFRAPFLVFEPLRMNDAYLKALAENQARELGIDLGDITITSAEKAMFDFLFPEVKAKFKTSKGYRGRMSLFISRDLRILFFAVWKNDSPHKRYIARIFPDFITLKRPYDSPLYKRPVLSDDDDIDAAAMLKQAETRFVEAVALWKNADEAPDNVKRAMEKFQKAMALVARSEAGAEFIETHRDIVEVYKKCREYRRARLDRMKSEVIQAERLGNHALATEIAKELLEMASLDGESAIRMWAKKQIGAGD